MRSLQLFGLVSVSLALLSGCEATPKSVPATASGKKIDIINIDDDVLIRVYHAQLGAPPMNRDTVLTTLAQTRSSAFSQPASMALGESDASWREQSKNLVFRDFSGSVSKTAIGAVLAIPVNFSVMPRAHKGADFQICIEGICAKPFTITLGQGAYKIHLTVTTEKFLTLSAPFKQAKELEASFDHMGRNGKAVVYATVDRVSLEARYTPTIYASVYRVSLKERPQYSEPSVMGIYRYPEIADIQTGNNP